ncbi:predicted protein [Coccidioides posadasii str. Silveira]|uniref:Predicted protein n=2 Tax=Coccidioides posadasii TaxID=199306 RepID=E9CW54_COCPS|nr:predicted protein [Coccidioides posadasii str. Silveira]KMM65006.1 hypothetical protein CPAG_01358 [Coccidioides posadasii RMSCC 3488]
MKLVSNDVSFLNGSTRLVDIVCLVCLSSISNRAPQIRGRQREKQTAKRTRPRGVLKSYEKHVKPSMTTLLFCWLSQGTIRSVTLLRDLRTLTIILSFRYFQRTIGGTAPIDKLLAPSLHPP